MKSSVFPLILTTCAIAAEPLKPFERDGLIGAENALSWRVTPLPSPAGGEKFAGSAFFPSLRTPSGFELNCIQPKDHLHHFGLWWPWKFIETGGTRHNTWELQEGQGAHQAKSAKLISSDAGTLRWEMKNQFIAKSADVSSRAAIDETATITLSRVADSHVLDIEIQQAPVSAPVSISSYRYSGFSWRGTSAWNKDNSTLLTSGGKGRDNANGTPARWLLVSGTTPNGKATMLIMSAAADIAGSEEKVRVWDSRAENGAPFANFNPVMDKPMTLDSNHKAVSHRKYRIVAADRAMDATEAEAAWKDWLKH
jgi:Methane oxygenase PmoA